uniref:Secreted protein n=1 Tax=Arundo donax TaxID=35708 RepID=A0A0A8Z5X4_ARUDO
MLLLSSFLAADFLAGGTGFSLGVISDEESGLSGFGEEVFPREGDGVDFPSGGDTVVAAVSEGP